MAKRTDEQRANTAAIRYANKMPNGKLAAQFDFRRGYLAGLRDARREAAKANTKKAGK
jgi:hypothetical protein